MFRSRRTISHSKKSLVSIKKSFLLFKHRPLDHLKRRQRRLCNNKRRQRHYLRIHVSMHRTFALTAASACRPVLNRQLATVQAIWIQRIVVPLVIHIWVDHESSSIIVICQNRTMSVIGRSGHIYSPFSPNQTMTHRLSCTWIIDATDINMTAIRFVTVGGSSLNIQSNEGNKLQFVNIFVWPLSMNLDYRISGNYTTLTTLNVQLADITHNSSLIIIEFNGAANVTDDEWFDIYVQFTPSGKRKN